jgi:hypothetical protein
MAEVTLSPEQGRRSFDLPSNQPDRVSGHYGVEMKIRRHLARACKRRGFGWKRWSREWMYATLGLFSEYRVSYRPVPAVVPV